MATYDVFLDIVEHSMDIHKRDAVSKSSFSGFIAISGSIAGLMSWLFVVPFDVVKTKMQAETDPKKHPTMIQTAVEVFKVRKSKLESNLFFIFSKMSTDRRSTRSYKRYKDDSSTIYASKCSHVRRICKCLTFVKIQIKTLLSPFDLKEHCLSACHYLLDKLNMQHSQLTPNR